jgi:hypothetical protein
MYNVAMVPSDDQVIFYPIGNTPAVNLLSHQVKVGHGLRLEWQESSLWRGGIIRDLLRNVSQDVCPRKSKSQHERSKVEAISYALTSVQPIQSIELCHSHSTYVDKRVSTSFYSGNIHPYPRTLK